jgi:hypothetical protein
MRAVLPSASLPRLLVTHRLVGQSNSCEQLHQWDSFFKRFGRDDFTTLQSRLADFATRSLQSNVVKSGCVSKHQQNAPQISGQGKANMHALCCLPGFMGQLYLNGASVLAVVRFRRHYE